MSTILREDQYFDHEEDFCITESTEAKNKLEDIFLKNRISYFIKPEKRSLWQKLLGKRKNSCVFRINSRDIGLATDLVEGLSGIIVVGVEPEPDWSPNAKLARLQEERERMEQEGYEYEEDAGMVKNPFESSGYEHFEREEDADYEDIVEVEEGVYVRMGDAAEYERTRRGRYFGKYDDLDRIDAVSEEQEESAPVEADDRFDEDDEDDEYDHSSIIVEVIREKDSDRKKEANGEQAENIKEIISYAEETESDD